MELSWSAVADGEKVFVNAETIILALGVQPRKEVVKAFKDAFSQVHIIGDANRGGRILEATQEAYGSALSLNPDNNRDGRTKEGL